VLAVDSVLALGDTQAATADDEEFPKAQSIASLTMLKRMLNKARELLNRARKWKPVADSPFYHVRYTSVPVWKPWRDF